MFPSRLLDQKTQIALLGAINAKGAVSSRMENVIWRGCPQLFVIGSLRMRKISPLPTAPRVQKSQMALFASSTAHGWRSPAVVLGMILAGLCKVPPKVAE